MALKLWEKSFLFTFTVFFVLLNICLGTYTMLTLKGDYESFARECEQEAKYIIDGQDKLRFVNGDGGAVDKADAYYRSKGIYLRLSIEDEILMDSLPGDVNEKILQGKVTVGSEDFYYINKYQGDCRLIYLASLGEIRRHYRNMMLEVLLIDVFLGIVIGVLIYIAMKKIYKPVSNIAHELRTPLTGVLGYAQLLSFDAIDEKDRRAAEERLIKEARYMKDIVERLLTVDGLCGRYIEKRSIDFNTLISEFAGRYPQMRVENHIDSVKGEEALVRVLLSNIIENAAREDANAVLVAADNTIIVSNKTDSLDRKDIQLMNKGKPPAKEKVKGHGIGMELSFEIAKYHGWKISYELKDGILSAVIVVSQ